MDPSVPRPERAAERLTIRLYPTRDTPRYWVYETKPEVEGRYAPRLMVGPTYLRQQGGVKPYCLSVTVDIVVEGPTRLQAGRFIDEEED